MLFVPEYIYRSIAFKTKKILSNEKIKKRKKKRKTNKQISRKSKKNNRRK